MIRIAGLELFLEDIFVKKAPKLPENGKKSVVRFAPILALFLGIITLLSVTTLWHWAHVVNNYNQLIMQLCNTSPTVAGCGPMATTTRLTTWIWVSLLVLLTEAILYLAAYTGLRDHKKQGWNYVFYGAIVNLCYAFVTLFSNYGGAHSFIGSLIGSALGFYLLFQIREYYVGKKSLGLHASQIKHPTKD